MATSLKNAEIVSVAEEIRQVLLSHDSFAIAGHVNPDGDAIGSCLAMGLSLEKLGKKAWVLLEPYNNKYEVIPGGHLLYEGDPLALSPQVMICMDCGSSDRLGAFQPLLAKTETVVCIDHHVSNSLYGKINCVDPQASSTSEMVLQIMEGVVAMDKDIASALYAGIVFDTGGFRHGCTGVNTHLAAAKLLALEIPFTAIYSAVMQLHSLAEAKIFGKALEEMRLSKEGRLAYALLPVETLKECGATAQDLDGIVEYFLNTRGVEAAVLFYEKEKNDVKASFRSRSLDVSQIALLHGGGGHRNAAGCSCTGELSQVARTILNEVEEKLA